MATTRKQLPLPPPRTAAVAPRQPPRRARCGWTRAAGRCPCRAPTSRGRGLTRGRSAATGPGPPRGAKGASAIMVVVDCGWCSDRFELPQINEQDSRVESWRCERTDLEDAESLHHLQLNLGDDAQRAQVDGGGLQHLRGCALEGIGMCWSTPPSCRYGRLPFLSFPFLTSRKAGSGSSFLARSTSPELVTSSTARIWAIRIEVSVWCQVSQSKN